MGELRVVHAIAESCPFDALLVRDMKSAVSSLLQLNLKRFRLPEKTGTKYSALDVMKQALELLFEFSPSERNYREAMRTIQVYSEGDEDMARTLRASFRLIANAVYNAYTGQRYAEAIAPEILFLQGTPFEPIELQQAFRFIGVKPPELSPSSVRKIVFLDEGFEPYTLLLEGKPEHGMGQGKREEHWSKRIEDTLESTHGPALIRAERNHFEIPSGLSRVVGIINPQKTAKLPGILREGGIQLEVVHWTADINRVFGKGQSND
jgi:hypothetical protein